MSKKKLLNSNQKLISVTNTQRIIKVGKNNIQPSAKLSQHLLKRITQQQKQQLAVKGR